MASTEPPGTEEHAEATVSAEPAPIVQETEIEPALEPELAAEEPELPRKPRFAFKFPRIRLPRIRINVAKLLTALFFLVAVAVLVGIGAAIWFFGVPFGYRLLHHGQAMPTPAPRITPKPTPTPSPIPTLMPLPPEAPHVTDGLDPRVIGPFAFRLAGINQLVGDKLGTTLVKNVPVPNKLVTEAEYHDSDVGTRYFTAIVSSCKDLLALYPIQNGSLAKLEGQFRLEADFDKFAFVERYSEGQWGLSSCDDSM